MKVIAAILEGFSSRADRSIKVVFGTSEATPEMVGYLQTSLHKEMFLALHDKPFQPSELDELEKVKAEYTDTTKSPSKRLRNVLYVLHEQTNDGSEFEDFYIHTMEKLINHYKSKLI